MSYPLYPALAGVQWDIVKRPLWNTLVEQTASGAEFRTATQQYPIYEFDLKYEYLTTADVNNILGLYLNSQGGFNPFYFDHPNDDTISTPLGFGTGDGTTTKFSLSKSTGSFIEPAGGQTGTFGTVTAPGVTVIFDNGTAVAPANYSLSDGGLGGVVTFTVAPLNTHVLTWTGLYKYLCRFKDDQLDISQFANLMYEQKGLTLRTVR